MGRQESRNGGVEQEARIAVAVLALGATEGDDGAEIVEYGIHVEHLAHQRDHKGVAVDQGIGKTAGEFDRNQKALLADFHRLLVFTVLEVSVVARLELRPQRLHGLHTQHMIEDRVAVLDEAIVGKPYLLGLSDVVARDLPAVDPCHVHPANPIFFC